MAKLVTDYSNYVAISTTKTLKTGKGKVHAILATCSASGSGAQSVTLYDNTAGSGNILFLGYLWYNMNCIIILPDYLALKFSTGLTVVTSNAVAAFIATEEAE